MTLAPAPVASTVASTGVSTRVAAAACGVAGVIHLWVMPEHLVVSLPAGLFFLVVGCGQLLLAAVLVVESPGSPGTGRRRCDAPVPGGALRRQPDP